MKKFKKFLLNATVITIVLFSSINVFAQGQVVKVSIGSTKASVNGKNITLSLAPYVQQPSDSMMIPLRFVSTGLGIDESAIQYNANTKEIKINYNGTTAKFIVGTDKLVLNGEEYSMRINNTRPVYTEIKNGSTFIPLRSLELAFGVKIDWEASTKTATLTNGNVVEKVEEVTEQVTPAPIQPTEPTEIEKVDTAKEETVKTFDEYTGEEIRAMEEEVVRLVNEERAKHGLQPLEMSEKLMQTAKIKSDDMATRNYFSHTDPDGYTLYKEIEKLDNYWTIMENCHAGSFDAKASVLNWLDSPPHREQILNPDYKYIGVGLSQNYNSEYINYWTQHFSKDDKWANE